MAIKQLLQTIWRGKSAGGGSPYSGSSGPGPYPLVDLFRKTRPPSAVELVRENVGTAYACAMLNANGVAKTPLKLYVQTRRGESPSKMSRRGDTDKVSSKSLRRLKSAKPALNRAQQVEEVLDHPLLDLLNNPNANSEDGVGMSLYQLVNLTQLYQEVVGRAYWWTPLNGLGGRPSAIWILAGQFVNEIVDRTTNNVIDRYTFGMGDRAIDYSPKEVAPFRFPDLNNPYLGGVSPMRATFAKARLNQLVDSRSNALLSNGGMPSAVFVPSPSDAGGSMFEPSIVKRLQAKLNALMAGAQGRVMVAEHPGQIHPLQWPLRDIADFETLRLSKVDICNGYDVPPGLLDPQDQNLTAIQAARTMHAENAIEPRCRRNEAALNRFIVPKYDDTGRLFFAYDSPVPDDGQETRDDSKTLLAGNAVKRNELRQRHGMDAVDGPEGDEWVGTGGGSDEDETDSPGKKPGKGKS